MLTTARLPDLADELAPYLSEAERAALSAGIMLPAARIAALCVMLRDELRAVASYIPAPLVREQLDDPAPGRVRGAYWDGSVLFADLSGFTALSGALSVLGKQGAEEISAVINRLFGALLEEVHRYAGSLLKFGGDALTAFFDATQLGEAHALLAARSALAMQERMAEFAVLETPLGAFPLQLRVGVHSGQVFAAQVGDLNHIELVITGRNINYVAEAQEIAEPGEVVVSRATRALLGEISTVPRTGGFAVLHAVPQGALATAADLRALPAAGEDLLEASWLAQRLAALRPYLPRQLPARYLDQGGELGEFRTVSVLFANVAPFNQVLALLGEESDRAAHAFNAYYRRAQDVVHRYGGIVNKVDMYTRGDKLMALFGAPVTHEDDPQRAVRCAAELRGALAEANAEILDLLGPATRRLVALSGPLEQRVGINTGVVFAGRVGSPRRHEYTVMGSPVNLAARLMSAAQMGAIVISPSTRRAVADRVELRDLPPALLKGVPEPVPLAEVVRVLDMSAARAATQRVPIVGRTAELSTLLTVARAALRGQGAVVALSGAAGVGKSRLVEELLHTMVLRSMQTDDALPPFFPFIVESQGYAQNVPYAAIRPLLAQVFDLRETDDSAQATVRLEQAVVRLAPTLVRFAPLLGDIVGIPMPATPITAALDAGQRRDRAHGMIEQMLLAETRRDPLMLIFDDLQWGDASSRELIARLTRAISGAPLLLLLCYRSDTPLDTPWLELPHTTPLALGELSERESSALFDRLLDDAPPPGLDALAEHTRGNPFFIEEVVRTLVDDGTLARAAGGWHLTRPLTELSIPGSIEGVITARLDRLADPARDVVQTAAVIGRRFDHDVLDEVLTRRERLDALLAVLIHDDLIEEDRPLTSTGLAALVYLFKHALTRDVAYESILYARRRDLHRRVGATIERLLGSRVADQLGLLARHALLAEDWPRAFDYHLRAGRQAQDRYANGEAIALLTRAAETAARAEAPAALRAEIDERLGTVHALLGEYDPALMHYSAALERLRANPVSADDLVRLHHQIARVYEKRAEFDTAFAWVERGLAIDPALRSGETVGCLLLGAGLHRRQGRYQQAIEWSERARQLATTLGRPTDQAHALMLLGGAKRSLGDNADAFALVQQSLALFSAAQSLAGMAMANNDLANTCYELGQLDDAAQHYAAAQQLNQMIGDVYGQAVNANNLGDLYRLQGRYDAAREQFAQGLAIFERLGSAYAAGVLHMNLGAAQIASDDLAGGAEHLEQSARLFAQVGAEEFLPELERYTAELHLRRGELEAARAACVRSLDSAAKLEARAEEGITRRTLAAVLVASGAPGAARVELAQSLALLREANTPYEVARTLLAIAQNVRPESMAVREAALSEALPIFERIGARADAAMARGMIP